jgi:hypothetical protein
MNGDDVRRMREIQLSMGVSARPAFSDCDVENLQILIRLAMDFFDQVTPASSRAEDEAWRDDLRYHVENALIHQDKFRAVVNVYACVVGAERSALKWEEMSKPSLFDTYAHVYQQFLDEETFEPRCRSLLDLIRIQLVCAGVFYDV